ncbi:hypothetical protein AKO1_011424 [Acrasis kona]|uniref:Uncharacterized protein n=1 Tax=Acrasis kona TaxID=1008807 RepID=A0AAW2ZIM4_9EUKA
MKSCPPVCNSKVRGKTMVQLIPICNPTKPYNNKENVIVNICGTVSKVCRVSHFQEQSMLEALTKHYQELVEDNGTDTESDNEQENGTSNCVFCKKNKARKEFTVKPRDAPDVNSLDSCSLVCLLRHMALSMKLADWKEYVKKAGSEPSKGPAKDLSDTLNTFFADK